MTAASAARLAALLPQTQCRRCGYAGCQPFADALACGNASPNDCPPGGETTRRALHQALGREPEPPHPIHPHETPRVARVVEPDCIGCTHCIRACPVDAIVGAAGLMHGVVAPWCTGCALCLPACPTDCIELVPAPAERPSPAALARRHAARQARAESADDESATLVDVADADGEALRAAVEAAVRRRRAASGTGTGA